ASGGANHETLDISTILKAAHAIAEKIDLHEFLKQMLKIAIENAGARRGVLIEEREGELFIAAEGTVDSDQVALPRERLGSGEPRCCAAVVNYVYRTKVSLVIADAALDERFAQDDYVARTQSKSILCLPIVHQGELSAILYLENNLIQGAFTRERIEVMEILSGQAAISFEKVRLFDRMKQEIAQRQHAEQDLKRALAERKRSEEMLRSIAEGTGSVTGAEFFHSLVRHLASALQVRYAFVAECFVNEGRGERTKCARSRAFWKADGFGENFEYEVPGTPCMEVLDGQVCHYVAHVQELFPDDKDLVSLGAESYIGAPLVGASGEVIGHVAILDTKPIEEASVGMSVLKVFASRAGAELERLKADEGLKRALAELERLKNQLQDEKHILARRAHRQRLARSAHADRIDAGLSRDVADERR
ncbi:MAG TPA: GAF domain-containing protein, partial [Burkholderiales bacterium]|nr:GAF domain-containing protein [Burkholderiales bacterium]